MWEYGEEWLQIVLLLRGTQQMVPKTEKKGSEPYLRMMIKLQHEKFSKAKDRRL